MVQRNKLELNQKNEASFCTRAQIKNRYTILRSILIVGALERWFSQFIVKKRPEFYRLHIQKIDIIRKKHNIRIVVKIAKK